MGLKGVWGMYEWELTGLSLQKAQVQGAPLISRGKQRVTAVTGIHLVFFLAKVELSHLI